MNEKTTTTTTTKQMDGRPVHEGSPYPLSRVNRAERQSKLNLSLWRSCSICISQM